MEQVRLDKNFKFMQDWEHKYKDEILMNLDKVIKFIRTKDYEEAANNARKICETLIKIIFEEQEMQLGRNLSDNISRLKKTQLYGPHFINALFSVSSYGNIGSHAGSYKITKNDAIIILCHVHTALSSFADVEGECDFSIYFDDHFGCEPVINEKYEESINNVKDFLTIDKRSIYSWLKLENTIIKIPIYQRGYDWDEQNVKQLLDDIKLRQIDKRDHYFGTIAAKNIEYDNF